MMSQLKKIIKDDNVGDTNYSTVHNADRLLSENRKMGWKARSFYRLKNKEERRYLMSGATVNLVWGEKAQSWLGVWALAGYTAFIGA